MPGLLSRRVTRSIRSGEVGKMGNGHMRRPRWAPRIGLAALLAVGAGVAAWQLSRSPEPTTLHPDQKTTHPLKPTPGLPWFEDVTRAAGIDFVHFDPRTDRYYIQETMGSGIGWIDYDNDGWPDLSLVQDGPVRPSAGPQPTCKLYRNNGDGTFTDV